MVYCTVPLCKSKQGVSDSSISYHEYPSDAALREKWLRNVSRGPDPGTNQAFLPADRSKVCSRHFKPEDFIVGAKCKRLRRDAVPTVFEEYPTYKQPEAKPAKKSYHLPTVFSSWNLRV
ncbi:THAP domain-containing protein 2-like [Ornithodoros turicata]|uniref:THAP domain-containing protein 2-like n=1 Tax=Ornithodoros turicata TaxID=34597 RepID=UPI0031387258